MTDPVLTRFRAMTWHYGDRDPDALAELEERVAAVGRRRGLITYSELVSGVRFDLPNVRGGPRVIDVGDWSDLDRAIVGSFLGYMSMRSWEAGGFFSSALIVSKLDGSPSEGFYALLKELGLVTSGKSDKAMYLWADHVAKAHTWYARHPSPGDVRSDETRLDRATMTEARSELAGLSARLTSRPSSSGYTVEVAEPAILLRIDRLYQQGMSPEDVYDTVRGVWLVSERRHAARYALAVARGVVLEVYEIEGWYPAGTTPYRRREIDVARYRDRWEFVGRLAPEEIRSKYVGRSVANYFPPGVANPVQYANV